MRLISLKNLLPFALLFLIGTGAFAQGVSIGKTPNPAPPTATLHVFGDAKIEDIQEGGVEFLTRVPSGTGADDFQIRKLTIPTGTPEGSTWIWDGTKWVLGPGGLIKGVDPNVFIIDNGILKLKPGTNNGDILIWDGTQWVVGPGGAGGGYIGIGAIKVDNTKKPGEISLNSDGATRGQTWVWDGTQWTLQNVTTGWAIGGNNNITGPADYFGTQNSQPISIRTNAQERMRVTETGLVVVGSDKANGTDLLSSYASTGHAIVGYANGLRAASAPPEGAGVVGVGNQYGVYGSADLSTGIAYGVSGETYSTSANSAGVFGAAGSTTGAVYGVWGQTDSEDGAAAGIIGVASSENANSSTFGVRGQTFSKAGGSAGVEGIATGGRSAGVRGANLSEDSYSLGVLGTSTGAGNTGGMYYGVAGYSNKANGATGIGMYGEGSTYGVVGKSTQASGVSFGIYGDGNIGASGTKFFHIDHPLDPANKYLNHVSIESPEALNIYSGNITTDANGEAIVKLPSYFEALNKDFRYTLTPIGQFSEVIILKKISGNQFIIKSDKPTVEVSWMITAVRNDPYMQKYPVQVEQEKESQFKGKYLRPDLYNQPAEKGIFYTPESKDAQKAPAVAKPQDTAHTKSSNKRK